MLHVPIAPHLRSTAPGPRLTGFVVDGAGLPVVGADVTAEPEAGAGSASGQRQRCIADQSPHRRPASMATSSSKASHPGAIALRVTGAGLLAAEVRFVPVPSDEARIVVARQIAIDGTVTDGGKPVAGATVGIRGDAIGGALEIATDPRGAFHVPDLPEGRYQVYAWQQRARGACGARRRLGAGRSRRSSCGSKPARSSSAA